MNINELKLLAQLPLVTVGTQLIWKGLSKAEKDERLTDMWVAIIAIENPMLSKGMEKIYDWCVANYE